MNDNDIEKDLSVSEIDNNDTASSDAAGEWVSEPGSLSQPGYAAFGRPDGYGETARAYDFRSSSPAADGGGDASVNSSGASSPPPQPPFNDGPAYQQAAYQQPAYQQAPAPPPPAEPERSARRGRWLWPLFAVVLALIAGFVGAQLQTNAITAEVTDQITADIEAYMKDAGATVLYRSVQTTGAAAADAVLDVSAVSELAAGSVVEIATEYVSSDIFSWFYSGSNVSQGAGSGVILSEDGYILTCYHVIDGATTITVATRDGQLYDATLVGGDKEEDIAVLKVEAEGLTYAVLGDSDSLAVGSPVVAIGNPLGQLGGTVTAGYVSALERELTIDEHTYTLIQTDAAINSGNSGGGLFNAQGELVGLVNAKAQSIGVEGLGFAIPIDNIEAYIEDIISYGYVTSKVTLGVNMLDILDERTALSYRVDELGVYILFVHDNSNASYAGLQSGDRIISADGAPVEKGNDLVDLIGTKSVGDVLELEIDRNNEILHLSITLYGALPEGDQAEGQATPVVYPAQPYVYTLPLDEAELEELEI